VPFNSTIWTARKQGHHKTTHDHHQHTLTAEDGRSPCAKMMGNVDINPPFTCHESSHYQEEPD
jgi:hypothetical protein